MPDGLLCSLGPSGQQLQSRAVTVPGFDSFLLSAASVLTTLSSLFEAARYSQHPAKCRTALPAKPDLPIQITGWVTQGY